MTRWEAAFGSIPFLVRSTVVTLLCPVPAEPAPPGPVLPAFAVLPAFGLRDSTGTSSSLTLEHPANASAASTAPTVVTRAALDEPVRERGDRIDCIDRIDCVGGIDCVDRDC